MLISNDICEIQQLIPQWEYAHTHRHTHTLNGGGASGTVASVLWWGGVKVVSEPDHLTSQHSLLRTTGPQALADSRASERSSQEHVQILTGGTVVGVSTWKTQVVQVLPVDQEDLVSPYRNRDYLQTLPRQKTLRSQLGGWCVSAVLVQGTSVSTHDFLTSLLTSFFKKLFWRSCPTTAVLKPSHHLQVAPRWSTAWRSRSWSWRPGWPG